MKEKQSPVLKSNATIEYVDVEMWTMKKGFCVLTFKMGSYLLFLAHCDIFNVNKGKELWN